MAGLHQSCIVLSVDKASDNVAIIFKRFYPLTLIKQLGVTIVNSISNETYDMINTTNENDIIDKHTRLLSRFKLSINEENCLPDMYWLLKLPKNPIFRSRDIPIFVFLSSPLFFPVSHSDRKKRGRQECKNWNISRTKKCFFDHPLKFRE